MFGMLENSEKENKIEELFDYFVSEMEERPFKGRFSSKHILAVFINNKYLFEYIIVNSNVTTNLIKYLLEEKVIMQDTESLLIQRPTYYKLTKDFFDNDEDRKALLLEKETSKDLMNRLELTSQALQDTRDRNNKLLKENMKLKDKQLKIINLFNGDMDVVETTESR